MTDYVELHARTAFSFLEGASLPETLIQRAAALEMPAIAILDRNGVYGAPRFHMEGQRQGVRAHIGAEVAVTDLGARLRPASYLPHQHPIEPARLPVLAESRLGYQNLCRLISRFKLRESTKGEGSTCVTELEEFGEGLVCLTGGKEGPLAAALVQGGYEAAQKSVERLVGIFGERNVYVEIQRHFDREQEHCNRAAIRIARSLNLPLLATGGVNYALEEEREILDVFSCIRHKTTLDRAGRLLAMNAERHLRSGREMQQLFRDYPDAVFNTRALSSRLQFEMTNLGYEFPTYPVPDGETMDSFLRKRVEEGIRRRYLPKNNPTLYKKAAKQAEHELQVIERLGLAGYFLIVWDIVQYCKSHDVLVQGRGSAANSVVCYALEITIVDSVGLDLLFERFLSLERGEWPDIDIDLPSERDRERAIQYVYRRYGELGAAMMANVTTYRHRLASTETGKVLGFSKAETSRISALETPWEWRGPRDTLESNFRTAGFDLRSPRVRKYLEICERIQHLPRNLSQHSGGMVICQGRLDSVVPIERASMEGRTVIQWDKDDASDMKIIKVDLLGLGMMAVLADCLQLVPRHYEVSLDYAQVPQEPAVYETIQDADTVGLFQIESRAQMSAIGRTKPKNFEELAHQVAIIRPGPVTGEMVNPYIERKLGRQPVSYLHPSFEPFLRKTFGVPIFQEQVMKIGMAAADLTGGEAEELRKAMGGKRSDAILAGLRSRLIEGMTRKGIDLETQDRIFRILATVREFMFPESHAHSFASLAYLSAYVRHFFRAAYTCALINNQPMGFYSVSTILNDAKRHRLKFWPVDIQHSEWNCTLERLQGNTHERYCDSFAVRLGLLRVKALRKEIGKAIVQAREKGGPFSSEYDLKRRVPSLRKDDLTLLAKAGALNWTGDKHDRRTAQWRAERAGRSVGPLFENVPDQFERDAASPLLPMTAEERLVADFLHTGFSIGPHPMSYHRTQLNALGVLRAVDLKDLPDGTFVRIAGAVIARQRPGTASGFIFLSSEDETGISNAIVHPKVYERHMLAVAAGKFLLIEGILQNQDSVVSVKASSVRLLDRGNVEEIDMRSHDFH